MYLQEPPRGDGASGSVNFLLPTTSSSPNLIIVVRQSQGYFVTFACLSRSLFPLRFGAFVQLLSSFGRCEGEESGENVR